MKFKTSKMIRSMIHEAHKNNKSITKIKLGLRTFYDMKNENESVLCITYEDIQDLKFMGIKLEVDTEVKEMVCLEMEDAFQ